MKPEVLHVNIVCLFVRQLLKLIVCLSYFEEAKEDEEATTKFPIFACASVLVCVVFAYLLLH